MVYLPGKRDKVIKGKKNKQIVSISKAAPTNQSFVDINENQLDLKNKKPPDKTAYIPTPMLNV
jgi:hypothetical protein